jgi:UDP:flavonoid glycosyltransferase YjiC (YdhE family)
MRILLATEGSRGDVHPMLALAGRLRDAGHEPLLCAAPDFAADAAARGIAFRPFSVSIVEYLRGNAEALLGSTARVFVEGARFVETSMAAQFELLPEAARGCDLVVGASLAVAAPSAAELHGIPYRFLFFWPGLLPSAELPAFVARSQTRPRWVNRLGWRLAVPAVEVLLGLPLGKHRRRLGLPRVASPYRHLVGRRPILAADPTLAPLPRDVPFAPQQIPCLHPFDEGPLPAKLEAFLEAGPAPVYVGFGSMPDAEPRATTELVLEAIARVGARVVIGAGWAGLGDVPLPEHAIRVEEAPHASLFPRCAAVVHHGGAGTTTTAARAGVPQIPVPFAVDQHYWARRVELLGLGPPGPSRRRLSAQRLAEALAAVLENELLAERAAEIGRRLRAEALAVDPVAAILS